MLPAPEPCGFSPAGGPPPLFSSLPQPARTAAAPVAAPIPARFKKRRRSTSKAVSSFWVVRHDARTPSGGSPPQRRFERLELVDGLGVQPAGEVLPAVVGDDEYHVALVELSRDAMGDACDGPGRHAGEHALLLEQPPRPDDRVAVGDEDLAVQQAQIDDRRDEAAVQGAQALTGSPCMGSAATIFTRSPSSSLKRRAWPMSVPPVPRPATNASTSPSSSSRISGAVPW